MKTIHTEIGVGAPSDVVWRVLVDLPGWERWNPFMRIDGRCAVGEGLRVSILAPGRDPVRLNPLVSKFEEGREWRWANRLALLGLLDGEHGFRVIPEDVGRCRFEHFEIFRGLLAGLFFARKSAELTKGFEIMNRMLKREAERVAREQTA